VNFPYYAIGRVKNSFATLPGIFFKPPQSSAAQDEMWSTSPLYFEME
jgi:hypothetical protein